jgi:general secretion pathway protein F
MRFTLKAYRDSEGVIELALNAADSVAARRQAEAQGYRVLSVGGEGAAGAPRLFSVGGFSVPLFAQELLALLEAGLGLVETVALLAHKARHPEAQHILQELQRRIGEGRSFSQALEAIPAFPPLFVATVRASERSGHLTDALRRYLAYQHQLSALRDKVLAASIYPLLLLGVGGLVVLFLLAYVVPRFSRIYEDVGRAHLPLLSRWLMHWGQIAADHALALGVCAALFAGGLVYLLRRPATLAAIERWLWRLPAVGEQLRIYQLARFTRTVAMLLRGGIPLVAALGMVDELLRQPGLQAGLLRARQAISEGRAASDCFAAQGLATEIGTRLLVVGERSGELGEALERIAGFYDDEIAHSVEWFSRLFEPALMLGIGLLIGGIVILMYMPIFELASNIQ